MCVCVCVCKGRHLCWKTCGPTHCFILAINTFKITTAALIGRCSKSYFLLNVKIQLKRNII